MKKIIYCAMALAVIGCSGGKKPKESVTKLEPVQTTLTGDLKDYFRITDKGASINGDVMSVELMRTENDLPFDPDKTNPFGNGIFCPTGKNAIPTLSGEYPNSFKYNG